MEKFTKGNMIIWCAARTNKAIFYNYKNIHKHVYEAYLTRYRFSVLNIKKQSLLFISTHGNIITYGHMWKYENANILL